MYHSKESTTRGHSQLFNLGYVGSSHLDVVDYEAQTCLSLLRVPHFRARCEASVLVVLLDTSSASNGQELSQGIND
jgi:hypothetical protein